jgi:hypothetical protein
MGVGWKMKRRIRVSVGHDAQEQISLLGQHAEDHPRSPTPRWGTRGASGIAKGGYK